MRPFSRFLLTGALGAAGLFGLTTPASAEVDITVDDHCRAMAQPVADLYRAFFLRDPDESGLDFWTRWVSGGEGGITEAAEQFARSPEFADRYGDLDDQAFVVQLYANILGRAPDAEGLDYWIWALETGFYTRGEAVRVWSYSAEFHGVERGEDIPTTPLSDARPGVEVWCGTGRSQLRIERLPLDVGQTVRAAAYEDGETAYWPNARLDASVTARAEDNVVVASSGTSLYLHPNLAASVLYYQVDVFGVIGDLEGYTEEQLVNPPWVVTSTVEPPPWRQWPEAR